MITKESFHYLSMMMTNHDRAEEYIDTKFSVVQKDEYRAPNTEETLLLMYKVYMEILKDTKAF